MSSTTAAAPAFESTMVSAYGDALVWDGGWMAERPSSPEAYSVPMRLLAAAIALVVVTAVHAAEPLSAQDLARVNREMKKAADAVSKKYGDKKLSPEERKAMMNEQAQATRAVLEKNNLDAKEVARATAKNGKAVEAESSALEAKEAEAAKTSPGTAPAGAAPAAGSADADANEAAAMDQARGIGKGKQ